MGIGTAMFFAFIMLCAIILCVGILYDLIYALIDHPVVLGMILFVLLWALYTWVFMLRR